MMISVVSTLYKSELYLERFLNKTIEALALINCVDYELLFVNDGSPDNSLNYLIEKKKEIPQIKIIDLSRNFGHHYAMQAGLQFAIGDYIFLIDNDLETSPYILVDFYNEIKKDSNLDVVYGFQDQRKGSFIEKYAGKLFWVLINKVSDVKIPHNILTERLMSKKYVNALLELNDANLFLGGMMYWVGFNQKGIPIKKGERDGESSYSTKKRLDLMVQAITSFSGKPLEWLFNLGITISILSILFLVYLGIKKLIYMDQVQLGWTSIVAVNILILGITSTFLGLIGLYIFKIFKQVQGRPNVIIKYIYE